jgi:hypothetical protein
MVTTNEPAPPATEKRSTDPDCGPYTHHWDFGFCHTCKKPGRDQGDAPATEKAVCPHCEQQTATQNEHSDPCGESSLKWTCQPAPPEPAAPEMPEAVYIAANTLRASGHVTLADALLKETWHSQPVAVGMTEELSMVLLRAEYGATEDERNPNLRDGYVARLKSAIETVRQQAAQVKL